jgi:hypothetical protein
MSRLSSILTPCILGLQAPYTSTCCLPIIALKHHELQHSCWNETMANKPQPFRQFHITRALKAASAAGMRNPTCTVSLPNGTTIAIGSEGSMPKSKKSEQRGAGTAGGKKKYPSGGMSRPARGGQTGT